MKLPIEAKKWLLSERKHQQQEDDSKKRFLSSGGKDTTKTPDREKINSNIPNQYAKSKML
jgi:hypothetical protein